MNTTAQVVDQTFEGRVTESEQGYEINAFCQSLQPVEIDQDWEAGSTTYEFYDGSKVTVCGESYDIA